MAAGLAVDGGRPVTRLHPAGGRSVSGGGEYQYPSERTPAIRRYGAEGARSGGAAADLPRVLRAPNPGGGPAPAATPGPVAGVGLHHFQGWLRPDQQSRGQWGG